MINNETHTVLFEEETVPKLHPQICFRGQLDSLYAEFIYVCVCIEEKRDIFRQLTHICHVIKKMISIEALHTKISVDDLIEMDAKWLRTVANNPKTHIGIDHYLPDENDDMICILLNKLRGKTRECEIACIIAGVDYGANECLQISLNRLSTAVYIIMLRYKLKQINNK